MAHMSDTIADKLSSQINRQIGLLIMQFLLGMGLNLIGTPTNSLTTWSDRVLLLLHVVTAIVLIATAFYVMRTAAGTPVARLARTGAAAVGLAFIFGLLTLAAPLASLWSFGMAASFIAAFAFYAKLLVQVKSTTHNR